MSIRELIDFQLVLKEWISWPRAWLLQANPVWGSYETVNRIALFDTKEMAAAYLEASKLPKVEDPKQHTTKDGYHRTFRPDSLLWDYNLEDSRPMIVPAVPWYFYGSVTENPTPPSGPISGGPREWSPHGVPVLPELETHHPRYGRDFDQGYGGPRTNMDGVVPQEPPIKPE